MMVGYSYGSLIAIELVRRLEDAGYSGKVVLIDGAPLLMKNIKEQQLASRNNDEFQTNILIGMADTALPEVRGGLFTELKECHSWDEKLDVFIERTQSDALGISVKERRKICTCVYNRLLALDDYDISNLPSLRSAITLLKPTYETVRNLPADYDLNKVSSLRIF